MSNLLDRDLPKWPQMFTTGKSVTVDQAKEIIRRTDSFFKSPYSGGNNHKYDSSWKVKFGIVNAKDKDDGAYFENFLKVWQVIDTEYVNNSWISTCYYGGPHGWCHPDGKIQFTTNVGKYPSVENIRDEWKQIAEAFPFLDVGVTLMSGERCKENISPVVSLEVLNGKVTLFDPKNKDVHENHPKGHLAVPPQDTDFSLNKLFGKNGLPSSWMEEWAELSKARLKCLVLL